MKKYPYSLVVRKVIFCACSDLLGRLRQARPDETDHYKTVQVAPIKGAGPLLVEYSLKKRWPENDKDRWDEGTKNGPDRSALLGHNFVYQETKPHGFYSSYFHQRISS